MKKTNIIISFLLVLLLFTVSCSKKPEPEPVPPVEEPEIEVEDVVEEVEEEEEVEVVEEIEEEEDLPRSLLSGVETTEELQVLPIVGVMLDNHPYARWQAGLREAEIVYEIRVEGNATRYLALFQVTSPEAIGPIRSARTPFINRILEYDAIYLHYGADSKVMEDIGNLGINNVNGIRVGLPVYYRNYNVGKKAPHNAYSSMAGIREYTDKDSFPEKTEFTGYNFYHEPTDIGGEKVEEFVLNIMQGNQTAYTYLPEEGIYHRYKDDKLHLDENDEEPLEVTNIIVQFADGVRAANGVHTDIKDIGEGKGLFFSQGEMIDITWKKADRRAYTEFFNGEGQPLELNIGQTFIQVVDENIDIEIK